MNDLLRLQDLVNNPTTVYLFAFALTPAVLWVALLAATQRKLASKSTKMGRCGMS